MTEAEATAKKKKEQADAKSAEREAPNRRSN
jgi:hypothetical protein